MKIVRRMILRKLKTLFVVSLGILLACATEPDDRTEILVSPKAVAHSFWLTVKAGAEAAAKEENVTILWKGPAVETDIAGQIAILEDYIQKKVDALVFAACDAKGLIPAVEKAALAGIPVITIDSGVDSEIPASLIATDNVEGGREAARILSRLLDGKGKVACIPFVPGAATSIAREQGFREELALHSGLELVATQYSQSDVATGMAVTENILTAHPDLAGIYAANEPGVIGAAQALISRNLEGKVKVVGFDSAPNEIKALSDGAVQALIVQNPYRMGYQGVKAAVAVLRGEPFDKKIDTGVTVVTKENMQDPEIQLLINPRL